MVHYAHKVSAKGQLVIPSKVQEELGLADGVTVIIRTNDNAAIVEKRPSWVEQTRGALPSKHPPLEPEELEELIEATALIDAYSKFGTPS